MGVESNENDTKKAIKNVILLSSFVFLVMTVYQVVVCVFAVFDSIDLFQGGKYNSGPIRVILGGICLILYFTGFLLALSIFLGRKSEAVVKEQYKALAYSLNTLFVILLFFLTELTFVIDVKINSEEGKFFHVLNYDSESAWMIFLSIFLFSTICCGMHFILSLCNLGVESKREKSENVYVLVTYMFYNCLKYLFLSPWIFLCELCLICLGGDISTEDESDDEIKEKDIEQDSSGSDWRNTIGSDKQTSSSSSSYDVEVDDDNDFISSSSSSTSQDLAHSIDESVDPGETLDYIM